jgi:hypothetical protein
MRMAPSAISSESAKISAARSESSQATRFLSRQKPFNPYRSPADTAGFFYDMPQAEKAALTFKNTVPPIPDTLCTSDIPKPHCLLPLPQQWPDA